MHIVLFESGQRRGSLTSRFPLKDLFAANEIRASCFFLLRKSFERFFSYPQRSDDPFIARYSGYLLLCSCSIVISLFFPLMY